MNKICYLVVKFKPIIILRLLQIKLIHNLLKNQNNLKLNMIKLMKRNNNKIYVK